MHLGLNMLFLWIFGDNVEDSMGHAPYLVFYLLCGVAAAVAQGAINPTSTIPMVGASGAISGVLGAYMLLHPHATVRTLIFVGIFITVVHVPALVVLGVWFLMQIVSGMLPSSDEGGVAFFAHIGGFVAGMALVPFFKKPNVKLFQPSRSRPFEVERRRGPWANRQWAAWPRASTASGISLALVGELLGHSQITMTHATPTSNEPHNSERQLTY